MPRLRREHRAATAAGEPFDHPWRRPDDLEAAREAYLEAHDQAGGPPLRLRPAETIIGHRQRTRGAQTQSLWNAARFDPDPDVRASALATAVAYCRDELVGWLDRIMFGPTWARVC